MAGYGRKIRQGTALNENQAKLIFAKSKLRHDKTKESVLADFINQPHLGLRSISKTMRQNKIRFLYMVLLGIVITLARETDRGSPGIDVDPSFNH